MKLTIAQGVACNKIKALKKQRIELVAKFNRIAVAHRDVSGMYIKGSHSGAEYILSCIAKIDSKISELKLIA